MYDLSIITPEKIIFEEPIYSLIAPGEDGYLGILTDHAPIIASLEPGKLTVIDKNKKKLVWAVSYGFLEMSDNKAWLLVDAVERIDQIDLERSEAALQRALKRLKNAHHEIDVERAKRALKRADNRIKMTHLKPDTDQNFI